MYELGTILYWLCAIPAFIVNILFIVAAFRQSVGWGFLVMCVPFAGLVFLVKFWDEVGGLFIVGLILGVGCLVGGGMRGVAIANMSQTEKAQFLLDKGAVTEAQIRAKGYVVENGKVSMPTANSRSGRSSRNRGSSGSSEPSMTSEERRERDQQIRTLTRDINDIEREIKVIEDRINKARDREREAMSKEEDIARERYEEDLKKLSEASQAKQSELTKELFEAKAAMRAEERAGRGPGGGDVLPGLAAVPATTANLETLTIDPALAGELGDPMDIGPYTMQPPNMMIRKVANDNGAMFGRSDATIRVYLKPKMENDGKWPALLTDPDGRKHLNGRNYTNALKREYDFAILNGLRVARIGDPPAPGRRIRREFLYAMLTDDHFVEIKVEYRGEAIDSFPILQASVHSFKPKVAVAPEGDEPLGKSAAEQLVEEIEKKIEAEREAFDNERKAASAKYNDELKQIRDNARSRQPDFTHDEADLNVLRAKLRDKQSELRRYQ